MKISVIVPLYNERESVGELYRQLVSTLEFVKDKLNQYELIFVDDGSSDGTFEACTKLTPLTAIRLRRNFGQTAALVTGVKKATGDIIITIDGDLENDPYDIPKLIDKINEGYDVVSG